MFLEELLKTLYSDKVIQKWEKSDELMYYFIKDEFARFEDLVKTIPESEFGWKDCELFFKGNVSRMRIFNLLKLIDASLLEVLKKCYKGDLRGASNLLNALMSNKKTKDYLVESFEQYIDFKVDPKNTYYRMRDVGVSDSAPDNCNHVPFQLRAKQGVNRFTLQGIPCLYLADSPQTADAELRALGEGKKRWVSEFKFKESKKGVVLFDFRLNSYSFPDVIENYDKLKLLITYPLKLLCSLKKNDGDTFHEEYMIPQLLSHLIMYGWKEESNADHYNDCLGLLYDSTVNPKGYNIMVPVRYDDDEPVKEGYSERVEELFNMTKPVVYREKKEEGLSIKIEIKNI